MSKAVRRFGFTSKEWELLHGENFDLTRPAVRNRIKQDCHKQLLISAMLGPPCSSFSPARDRTAVIRTAAEPCGIAYELMSEKDVERVKAGNACFRAAFDLVKYFESHNIPWILENPHASKCWHLPFLQKIAQLPHVESVVTDFCQHGTPWRKRIRLLCSQIHYLDLHRLQKQCIGKHGSCSKTGKPNFSANWIQPSGHSMDTRGATLS